MLTSVRIADGVKSVGVDTTNKSVTQHVVESVFEVAMLREFRNSAIYVDIFSPL